MAKKEKLVCRISSKSMNEQTVRKDMQIFRDKALELGASAAEIIPTSYIVCEERVWLKCLIPRCSGLSDGGEPYCPPNTPKPDFMRKVFSQYRWAVLYKVDIPDLEDYVPISEADAKSRAQKGKKPWFHQRNWEVVGRLESYAQSKGYYLAMGFGGGSCKGNLCHGAVCGVVQSGSCRFPLRSRPSLEGVGIDVFDLISKVGWDSYMIRRVEPDLSVIPCGVSVGMVLIC